MLNTPAEALPSAEILSGLPTLFFGAIAAMEVCDRILARDNQVTIRWVPAHSKVEGNEKADDYERRRQGAQPRAMMTRPLLFSRTRPRYRTWPAPPPKPDRALRRSGSRTMSEPSDNIGPSGKRPSQQTLTQRQKGAGREGLPVPGWPRQHRVPPV